MSISPERLEEFKRIFKKKYNHEFKNDSEALEAATNLLNFAEVLYDIAQDDYKRQQKLKIHPNGFPLDNDGTYSCVVCFTSITTANGWYDKYGPKCLNCQRAVKKKILPPSVFKDRNSWFTAWHLEKEFKIHSATVRKLIRENKLKARVINREDGKPHYYIFLVSENIDYLHSLKLNK